MSTEAVYSQAPLVTERREIRILVLAPGTSNDVLHGELIVESLDYDDLHYTALSYTWSGSVGEHFISIGGAPLYITENLSLALRRIRGPTRPRNMWVDAICINQDDHEEKAIQVNLMGHIYASATRTIVWLGEKSADSDVAMDFIGSLQQGTLDHQDDDSQIGPTCWRAVNELMERKWWTRIWVVQEALMSRRVIIQCGDKRVDIPNFVKLLGESRVEQISDQPSPSAENPFKEILSNWYVHKKQVETSGLSLQALIFLTRGFHASVWRDRFFGLLGLATPEARSYLTPDYSEEVSDRLILIRLTMYLLRKSVQPLEYASLCRATNCPSWVPDWTAIDINSERHVTKTMPQNFQFRAAENHPHFEPPIENLPKYQEPLALLVHGFVVDRVQTANQIPHLGCIVSDDSTARVKSIKTYVREWELRMMERIELIWSDRGRGKRFIEELLFKGKGLLIHYLCKFKRDRDVLFSLQVLHITGHLDDFDRDWQIKILNRDLANHGELISDYEAWMQCFPSSEHAKQQSQGICKVCEHSCKRMVEGLCAHCVMGQEICRRMAGRTMFITDNAGVLFESLAVQEGDIICELLSSESFFVMRKADEIHWTLVGTLEINRESDPWHFVNYLRRTGRGQPPNMFRLR
ncbi:heterokaryon incompatibility protein-domain-containing protein [Usnea florida]